MPPPPPIFVKRAVSPLRMEWAPPVSEEEDVFCVGSENEEVEEEKDEDNRERQRIRRRRRRREDLGRAYLEGGGLWIQSASLKGPFQPGWRNPWAGSKMVKKGRGWERDGGDAGWAGLTGLEKEKEQERLGLKGKRKDPPVTAKKYSKENVEGGLLERRESSRGQRLLFQEPIAKRRKFEESQRHMAGQSTVWLKRGGTGASKPYDKIEKEPSPSPEVRPRSKMHGKPRESRRPHESSRTLAPYVSTIVDEAHSKFATSHNRHLPEPSPNAAPSSTSIPEFKYRYARDRSTSTSTSDKSSALFLDAPEDIIKQERSSSQSSTSSSGSSAFAKALNAAQEAQADSAVRTQSPTSTPKIDPEIKRLSFTASGRPLIRTSRPSSKAGPDANAPTLLNGMEVRRNKSTSSIKQSFIKSDKMKSLSKQSSKLSDRLMDSGEQSRDTLPEAQVIPEAPVQAVPSGPSTNLLETEKQSPKLLDVDENDSYINWSTQAANLKAERSFRDRVLHNWKDSIEKGKPNDAGRSAVPNGGTDKGLIGNNHQIANQSLDRPPMKSEPLTSEQQPLSTQAMIDEMSPFAITTIKKRPPISSLKKKRASFALSPTETRKKQQLEQSSLPSPTSPGTPPTALYHDRSMSTSSSSGHSLSPTSPTDHPQSSRLERQQSVTSRAPRPPPISTSRQNSSIAKPAISSSNLTSFSMLPNGTAMEIDTGLQDGQVLLQQQSPPPPPPPPPTFPSSENQVWINSGNDASSSSSPPHADASTIMTTTTTNNDINNERKTNSFRNRPQEGREDSDEVHLAIEEAGHFLGQWDVEAEARKGGGGVLKKTRMMMMGK